MRKSKDIKIIKSMGNKALFSMDKLRNSLKRSGASHDIVEHIVNQVHEELYEGISTSEIFHRAYTILKKHNSSFASKYKLKKAIYELGPTGFPFERFIAAILHYSGYSTKTNIIVNGSCVTHEIDVMAEKKGATTVIECKFHGEEGRKCNIKIPLYIHARYNDIKKQWEADKKESTKLDVGWVVTNTRFTTDAIQYGNCIGLYLLSWDYPKNDGLKDRIDRLALYPITVSTLLSTREKQLLLSRDVILYRQLQQNMSLLNNLGVSKARKQKILNETEELCNH